MKKKLFLLFVLTALVLALCACGAAQTAADPTPEPTATPEPTPTPFPEPVMSLGGEVYMNAQALPSGRRIQNGEEYIKLSEAVEALGSELQHEADSADFAFAWRKSAVELRADNRTARYLDRDRELEAAPLLCDGGADLYVPVKSFCDAAEIGYFFDEEFDTVYCTPATGNWTLPENYVVPVLMYHELGHASEEANLFVDVSSLEEQIQYLQENGYSPIWFEDLWHVEDFAKPVILVFDDGYKSMYTKLLPVLEKYQCKAEVAIVQRYSEKVGGMHMDLEEVLALNDSGLVALSSHGVNHVNVGEWGVDYEHEIRDSGIWMTRTLKKAPLTFVYPIGGSTPAVQEVVRENYRFGVKMVGQPFNTSDDPTLVYRYFIERQTWLGQYAYMLEVAYDDPGINNYVPRKRG